MEEGILREGIQCRLCVYLKEQLIQKNTEFKSAELDTHQQSREFISPSDLVSPELKGPCKCLTGGDIQCLDVPEVAFEILMPTVGEYLRKGGHSCSWQL